MEYAETGERAQPPSRWTLMRSAISPAQPYRLLLPAILSLPLYGRAQRNIPVPVHISVASDHAREVLLVEFWQSPELITVVEPDKAQLIVSVGVHPDSSGFLATLFAHNRCGRLVWSGYYNELGVGITGAVASVAASFKKAIERRKSRLLYWGE